MSDEQNDQNETTEATETAVEDLPNEQEQFGLVIVNKMKRRKTGRGGTTVIWVPETSCTVPADQADSLIARMNAKIGSGSTRFEVAKGIPHYADADDYEHRVVERMRAEALAKLSDEDKVALGFALDAVEEPTTA